MSDWTRAELLLLREVVKRIGKGLSPEPAIHEMLHLMSELLGLNRGRVVLRNGEAGPQAARIVYAYGLTQEQIERGHYLLREGVTGQVLATGHPAIIQDLDQEPSFLFRAISRSELPNETVSFLAIPIWIQGQVRGVLACHRIRIRQRHLNDDIELLGVLATLCGQLIELSELVEDQTRALEARNALLERALETKSPQFGIVGSSPSLLRCLDELQRVSPTNATVLLLGESGTGKELFARALHVQSARSDGPFVRVNCAAIPETLFESELFGHERGAFTGAQSARAGLLEQAQGGTLFLDEIGELPMAVQSKLLRVLQENRVTRLGGKREVALDVRFVAATNAHLAQAVQEGRFRQDLFYRLNVIPLRLPPLRDRPEDLLPLIRFYLSRLNQTHQKHVYLDAPVVKRLQAYDWPGNVRELANLMERLVLLAPDPRVTEELLTRLWTPQDEARLAAAQPGVQRLPNVLSDEALIEALRVAGHNQSRAAQSLGMTLRQFSYQLKKRGIQVRT